jgi:DNA-binding MarR family transcriptional regulator
MEAAGFVTRRPDSTDRRRVLVALTPKGRTAADAVPRLLDAISEQALEGFTPAEREQLVLMLEQLASNLGWDTPRERRDSRRPKRG